MIVASRTGNDGIAMDGCSDESVNAAIAQVIREHGRLDAVVVTAAPSARTLDPARNGDPAQVAEAFDAKALVFLRVANAVIPAMRDARPVVADLRRLGKVAKPVGKTARLVLESFKKGRGIQRALDYAFYQVAAINGYDSFGHYLRARLILNTCSTYYTHVVAGCSSKFAASASQACRIKSTA